MLFILLTLLRLASSSSSSPRFGGLLGSMRTPEPGGSDDPLGCSGGGYQFAALSSEACCCGNQLRPLVIRGCFDTSLSQETKDVKVGRMSRRRQQEGHVVLCRTGGTVPGRPKCPKRPPGFCVFFLHGPPGAPSRRPPACFGPNSLPVEAAYLCGPESKGPAASRLRWRIGLKEENTEDVWIFSSERRKQTVVAVCPVVADLTLNVCDNQLRATDDVSAELLMPVLRLTLEAECNTESDCNRGNVTNKHRVSRRHGSMLSHLDAHHPLHASDPSSCHLLLHLHLRLPSAGGQSPVLTTQEWTITVSGLYSVTVRVFNPVRRSRVLLQEPAGDLLEDIPRGVAAKQKCSVLFRVTAGSNVTVSLNAAEVHRNSSCLAGAESEATVVLLFSHIGEVVIELRAENRASSQSKSVRMCVEGKRKPQDQIHSSWQPLTCQSPTYSKEDKVVRICATKQVQPTNTDITFIAVADAAHPAELFWDFGDSRSARTSSRIITKRYQNPGSYNVAVAASWGQAVVTSDVFPVLVQRAVELSRLVHQASVLKNQTVTVSCRVNAGTDLTFAWSFGDGPTRSGQRTIRHVFNRTGEFTIKVVVSNLISSGSLSSLIFVVDRPCRPPPVKNMGPLRLQVWRFEAVSLGVTFESDVECDVSGGLRYSWTLLDSAGRNVPLSLGDKHKQILVLGSHTLQYNTYTATARVQIFGSVVYSNYTVKLQVMPSPLVAFIQGGTNIFINRKNTEIISLDGRASYDPDFPPNPLSYSWTCKPVSTITSSCFNQDIPTLSPELRFPISLLKDNFDQFQFRLTVHSGERTSSSETFLTITPDLTGTVSVHCDQCRGDGVNWDQPFSVAATCDDCNESVQFTWSLYLVNASSKTVSEVPFCSTADLGAPSAIVETPAVSTLTTETFLAHSPAANVSEFSPTVQTSDPSLYLEKPSTMKSEKQNYNLDHTDVSRQTSDFPSDPASSADWEEYFPLLESNDVDFRQLAGPDDYDASFPAEEGDPGMSAGRPNGGDVGSFSPGDDSAFDPVLNQNEGSNLVDPKPSVAIQEETLLDLHRDPIDRVLFESYTYTGISSSSLRFKPFSLRPKTRYLLEVTAKSQQSFLGRTQLFMKTSPAPEGVTCQVQPAEGMELHTHFSIFCTSGHQDLLYKYSFSAGGKPPRILYQGRDFQYYFNLPSGDPSDDYKVTIYTEIRSGRYGSATKPCPVTVRVKPSFLRDNSSSSPHHDPDLKLSESGLQTLSALLQLGNSVEVRNYISLLCRVLNRLSRGTEAEAQRRLRNVLICTVCELESSDQTSVEDSICILNDLLQVTNQVTLMSVRQVTSHVRAVSEQFSEVTAADPNHRMLDSLISLLSYNLQVVSSCDYSPETLRGSIPINQVLQLVGDILQTASDLMLRHILFQETKDLTVNTGLVTLHAASQNQTCTTIRSSLTTIYFPESLIHTVFARLRGPKLCVLRVLAELSQSPYCCASYPAQFTGPVVDLSLYKCSTRRRIHVGSLPQPISFELRHPQRNSSVGEYTLLRSRINYHNFSISQELLHQAVQVTVVFTPPPGKEFPIMLLFRMFERPTHSMHHLQRIHKWESNTVRITLPPFYINAAGVAHLALLDANFGKVSRRKQKSEQINYSLSVDSSLCLSWDEQQGAWTHHICRTQRLDTTVNCSCYQLRPLTVFQQQIQSSHDTADLDRVLSVSSNLTVFSLLMLVLILFIPGFMWTQRADVISEENRRVHFLSDNNPEDSYLYAVCIHTGLCSAACMTAKVYIVLCGEHGLSQTKELQAPGCTLFRRNSQDTFILSAADSLGPVWGVHIWHNNSGSSPDWYIKQVMVSEVSSGQVGRSWLFVSESWLAVNKDDGHVERMLRVGELCFARMLFLRFSDYLADFHMWISVYSCRWPNSFTHTQRLSVCLLLLSGYAAVNAVIIAQTDDQLESGIVCISVVSITAGLLSVVIVLPAATLISFLFRLCGIKPTGSGVQHASFRMTAKQDSEDVSSVRDVDLDSRLSRSGRQMWTQEAWRRKYQDTDMLSVSMTPENKDTNEEPIIQARLAKRRQDSLAFERSEGPPLQGLSLTSEGSYCEGRAGGILPESEGFGFQKTKRDEDQTFQNKRQFGVTSMCCLFLAWALCLLISLLCFVLSAVLGIRFSSSQVLLWIQSLFVSLISCIFFIQPALILAAAVVVSVWYKKAPDSPSFSLKVFQVENSNLRSYSDADQPEEQIRACGFPEKRGSHLEKLLRARQRARYLRLVRPPTPSELRKARGKRRREALIHKTLRDLSVCAGMLLLMTCISYYSSFKEHYQLNRAVKRHFIRNQGFIFIKKHEDWWKWTQTTLLDLLDQNKSDKTEPSYVGIGDLVIKKTERYYTSQNQIVYPPLILSKYLVEIKLAAVQSYLVPIFNDHFMGGGVQSGQVSFLTRPRTCDHTSCYLETVAIVGLDHRKSDAASELKLLQSSGWVGRQTVALKVQFTLYSPAPNLFTGVTLLTEQSPSGMLRPSVKVQSVRLDPTPAGRDHVVTLCQLLFLLLSLLQLCNQVSTATQQGLMGYWRTPSTWLDVSLLTVTIIYYVCCIYHSTMIVEVMNFLQKHNETGHVGVNDLSVWEQYIRSLRGFLLLLIIVKTVTVLSLNGTLGFPATVFTRSLSSLLSPLISGLILLVVLSCLGNLLCVQSSGGFSSGGFSSFRSLIWTFWGLRGAGDLSEQDFSAWEVLFLSASVVWTAMLIGATSSSIRTAKRPQSRMEVLTTAEMFCYLRKKVSELTGRHRQTGADYHEEGRTFSLEELEISVDELLFRLSALSNSIHHPLLPRSPCCRDDFLVMCPTPQPSDTQTMLNKSTCESDQKPVSCLFRSHADRVPDQRRKIGNSHPDIFEATSDREDVLGTKSFCSLSKTRSEVVEVLVHKRQETDESDMLL